MLTVWLGMKVIGKSHEITEAARITEGPSVKQYSMRMLDFFDREHMADAHRDFVMLVNSGVHPEHAFNMVTEKTK